MEDCQLTQSDLVDIQVILRIYLEKFIDSPVMTDMLKRVCDKVERAYIGNIERSMEKENKSCHA